VHAPAHPSHRLSARTGPTTLGTMDEHLSRGEIGKDAVQHTIEAAATTAGQVASIITGAVRDVAKALGGFATEVFEIREAARKAGRD
jgi:hypothetical protein